MANLKFNTTTAFINEFSGNVSEGSLVETLGYATVGDGGGAQWVKTATTGAVSQSPAQLADGAWLTDASGSRYDLVRSGNELSISKLGGVAGSDITSIMQAAITEISSNGGTILLPYASESNPCEISTELTIRDNVTVRSESGSRVNCWIKVPDSTGLSIFRVNNRSNVVFKDFSIDNNGTNQTSGQTINITNTDNILIDNVMVKDAVSAVVLIDTGCSNVHIGRIFSIGGGSDASRGVSINESTDINIDSVDMQGYTGSGINISDCKRVRVGGFRGYRDYATLGWTYGKGAIRITNNCEDVSIGTVVADGWSRGIFVLTGSKDVSISPFFITNCETLGVWIEGDDGSDKTGTENVTIAGGVISNTGLGAGLGYSVYLSGTQNNIVTGVTCDGDIVEESVNSPSDKNIITSCRVRGSITTVGASTINSNNIVGV
jgi:hypothetical protein